MSGNRRNNLMNLPVEILEYIFEFCDIRTLTRIASTCRKLKLHIDSGVIWKVKWQQITAKFDLQLDISHLPTSGRYKGLCRRAILSCSPPNVGKNTFNCDCVVKEVNSIIACDVGSATSWICWVGKFDKRGCPSLVAHFGRSSKDKHKEPDVNMVQLNKYLISVGHPRVSHKYVVGKDAKILSAMYPDLYKSDLYPLVCTQNLREAKSNSLPDVLQFPVTEPSDASAIPDPESQESSNFRRKSEAAVQNSKQDYVIASPESQQGAIQENLPQIQNTIEIKSQIQGLIHNSPSQTQDSIQNTPPLSTHIQKTPPVPQAQATVQNTQYQTPETIRNTQPQASGAIENTLPQTLQSTVRDANGNHDSSANSETVHIDFSYGGKQQPFELHHVVANGDIQYVDDFELILRHLFRQLTFGTHHYYHLHNTPMVILEPPNLSKESRDQLIHMVFQKLKIPRFCLYNKALSLAPCLGLNTYLVVDSGAHSTVVTPIVEMDLQRQAVQFKPIGGYHISYLLADYVTDKGLIDKVLIDSVDCKAVKEECFLAYSPTVERKKHHSPRTVCVQKPGGLKALKETHKVDLGTERFLAAEDMYLHLDLPGMIRDAVNACHAATHTTLLSRLILTGGNTQLTGFASRLAKDLKELMPRYASTINVVHPSTNTLSRALNAWTLHYKAAPLSNCQWISKEDYILHGVDAMAVKANNSEKIADPCQHQA